MKVALLIPWFLPNRGGAEIGTWELSRRMAAAGHEIHIITPRFKLSWPAKEQRDGLTIHRYVSLAPSRLRRLSEAMHCLYGLDGAMRLLNRIQPDLIHLNYLFFTGYAGMLWAVRNHRPVILSLVGNDIFDPYYIPCAFMAPVNRWIVNHVNEIVPASSFIGHVIQDKLLTHPRTLTAIPYGVDLKRFSPVSQGQSQNLRRRLGLPTDKTIVLTVQRLHERKGVHVYLEAAALALKRHPELVFVVVGGGPESEKLKALASRLGISSGVLFTGKVSDEDLPGYYQSADLFAFHSFHEGFGIVLLEAMACGRPIITTEAGGTKDIAVPGPGGRMVKPGDAGAFAQAIFDILKDRQAWAHMGEFNRRRTEEVYDWDKIAKQYLTLYERILEPAAA